MITLNYFKNEIFIYNVEDWAILRKEYRIIGHIVGSSSFIPSLPVKILPEEALILVTKNLAVIYETINDVSDADAMDKFENTFLQAQQVEYREIRKQQLETLIDKILEKRTLAGDTRSKEEIFNEELNKSSVVTKNNMLWPVFLQRILKSPKRIISIENIISITTPLRSKIFEDLWERGYYITSGSKFGGDFLVYFGDPITHHAIFIVKCVEPENIIRPSELIAFGRLGVTVKKRAVFATVENNEVKYLTVNWIDA